MRYPGYAFRQVSNAPVQVVFVAPSSEIDTWSKVPTKLSNRPVGFQRAAVPKHVVEVQTFFQDDEKSNCSPTAVLLGVEPNSQQHVSITDPETQSPIDLGTIGTTPIPCIIAIEFTAWNPAPYIGDIDAEIEALYKEVSSLYESLEPAVKETEVVDDDENGDDEGEEENEGIDSEDENADGGGDDEDGVSTKAIVDTQTFLARLSARDLIEAVTSGSFKAWQNQYKTGLRDQLKDDRKIGIIIDGQHRVKGTAASASIPFVVSLLPYASWAELAFQFIVNNGTAKPVDEGLLIAIVGHSLSPEEITQTQGRLYRSGIQVQLIQAVMRVQMDENPFHGMLRFNIPGEKGFLEAPAMQKKVIKLWYGTRGKSGTRPKLGTLRLNVDRNSIPMFDIFGGCSRGSNANERARHWQDGLWFEYFRAFWAPIADHFKDDLWPSSIDSWPTVSSESKAMKNTRQRLMRVTVLGLLQSAVLHVWYKKAFDQWEEDNDDGKPFKTTPKQLERGVGRLIKLIPKEFFTELKFTGFDASKDTRKDLEGQMLALLERNKDFPTIRSEHKFWKVWQ